jgi:undecaprenyl-diphosphatase
MVVYGFLAFLLGHGKPVSRQTLLAVAAAAVAVLVAFSRLYLGAHWLSDVIASFGLGIAWVALLGIAYIQHVDECIMRATPVLAIVLATLALVGGPYASRHHERDLARYASPVVTRTLSLDAWRRGEWASLPAARTEIGGEREEPLGVQWAATRGGVGDALEAAGWERPAAWRSSASLLWLLPSTPVAALPVLPKFHQGQPPALTYIRPIDARTRNVIRLWRVAEAAGEATSPQSVPIWAGMITAERSHSRWGVVAVVGTQPRLPAPRDALADALRGRHATVETRPASGQRVLLAW